MQLRDHADIRPALPVDRNQGFDTHLKLVSNPKDTWIDRAGRQSSGREGVGDRSLHGRFDDRDQMIDKIRQSEINDR